MDSNTRLHTQKHVYLLATKFITEKGTVVYVWKQEDRLITIAKDD